MIKRTTEKVYSGKAYEVSRSSHYVHVFINLKIKIRRVDQYIMKILKTEPSSLAVDLSHFLREISNNFQVHNQILIPDVEMKVKDQIKPGP